jgi:hypothetical protein
MSEEGKPDRITFSPDQRAPTADKEAPGASPTSRGLNFSRFSQTSRDTGSGLFQRSRTLTKDRDREAGVYDEGFDAPRESDFRQKQIFHGWKLILFVSALRKPPA